MTVIPSVLWRCWLCGRKGIRPVKNTEWWFAGMVICLEQGADLHMAQLMPLPLTVCCFSKFQIGFTFLVPAHPGSPGKRAIKRVCVCVTVWSMLCVIKYSISNIATLIFYCVFIYTIIFTKYFRFDLKDLGFEGKEISNVAKWSGSFLWKDIRFKCGIWLETCPYLLWRPPQKTDRPVKLAPKQARKLSEIERSSEWVESATLSRVVSNTDKKVLQYQ